MAGTEWDRYLAHEREAPEVDAFDAVCAGQPAQPRGRRLRAEILRVLCWDPGQFVKGRIILVGARVVGRLSLTGLHLRHGLSFRGCHLTDGVDLSRADFDDTVEFDDCELPDLTVDGVARFIELAEDAWRTDRWDDDYDELVDASFIDFSWLETRADELCSFDAMLIRA